ncbi:MAG: DUF1540 domain-containing protein [Clostridia bacterium]|nr:DUF1540 domain-containing protein [Clostridia bacterium]MDD4048941.1 DUF1540 domain-containing protein [Clostridia bacterium]
MEQNINCIVNDCQYYSKGNQCTANKVLVTTNQFSENHSDNLDYEMANELSPQRAGNCTSTCCATYVKKSFGNTTNKN